MAYTGSDICLAAAGDLNDVAQGSYTNAILFPHLKTALRKLKTKFLANSLPYFQVQEYPFTVAAGTTVRTVSPSKLLWLPEQVFEGAVGDGYDSYVEIERVQFLPVRDAQTTLNCWAWIEQAISFPPCTAARSVWVRFIKDLTMIAVVGDTIAITGGELFLQKKTAALACAYIGENYTRAEILSNEADEELDSLIRMHVKNEQAVPSRRQPYRGNRWRSQQR